MADYFVFEWDNGYTTEVELPDDFADCSYDQPSPRWGQFATEIVDEAQNSDNLHEVEQYILQARSPITSRISQANDIYDFWDEKEEACAGWKCDCWFGCACSVYKWCYKKGIYCYKSESDLEAARDIWENASDNLIQALVGLDQLLADTQQQIADDLQQATDQALLDQLIAETNQIISLTAYQNEIREVKAAAEKTKDIFAPIIITLVILAVSFYLIKK